MSDQGLIERAAREIYAGDLGLAIKGGYAWPHTIRVGSRVERAPFDRLPQAVKAIYYAAATAPVVDCTTRGWRERTGIRG